MVRQRSVDPCSTVRFSILFVLLVLALRAAPAAVARVVYVDKNASGGVNDGQTWSTAFRTIQEGIDAAAPGDEVWVVTEMYTETVTLAPGVSLYGGFWGNETARSQRDPQRYETILDGNGDGPGVTVAAGATANTAMDGFTITNAYPGMLITAGMPTISGNLFYDGGDAIRVQGGTPTISANRLIRNSGNGIECTGGAATITGNEIRLNSSFGIYVENCSPVISGNQILGNSDSGIDCYDAAPRIERNTISGNGDSGIYCDRSSPAILGNTLRDNKGYEGGAIHCRSNSAPLIANNAAIGNHADSTGGAFYCYNASPLVYNNTFIANTTPGTDGGIVLRNGSAPTLVNNIVAFGSAGIVADTTSLPTLRSNDVFGNAAYDYSGLTDPTGTNGNIRKDPQIADRAYGNGRLTSSSPCVNAGDDAPYTQGVIGTGDADGNPRQQGSHIDIGAYEWGMGAPPLLPGPVIRVSKLGNDANDGSSWTKAKLTIQEAVYAVPQGGEVWVAAGSYLENVLLYPNVSLYGGFSGSETSRAQRNPSANKTVLDADNRGKGIFVAPGSDARTVLDGFTITGGGPAIYVQRASAVISNNTFNANGDAISCIGGHAVITGNTLTDSSTGVGCSGGSPTITGNTISTSTDSAIYCDGAFPVITGNTLSSNRGYSGAGVYCYYASPWITGNTLSGNSASDGGGIYCEHSSPLIDANTLWGNKSSDDGGAIYCGSYSMPRVTNNVVGGNTASGSGGAVYAYSNSNPVLINNTFVGNSAGTGKGVVTALSTSSPTLVSNIFASGSTGVEKDTTSSFVIRDNLMFGNTGADYTGIPDQTGKNGNQRVDPKFVNAAAGDYHLAPGSPCIDAGDDLPLTQGQIGPTDRDGKARKSGAHVDIGAYEVASALAFTRADATLALKIAGGGTAAQSGDATRLNAVLAAPSATRVDILDAVRVVRKAAGLDPNP